jgi:hypothetical protein
MVEQGPWPAIVEHLAARPAKRAPVHRSGDPTRPVPSLGGGPFSADPATVRLLKQRGIPGRRLFAVTFEDEQRRQRWFWLVAAEQDETGAWVASGGAGGSGQGPEREEPWVNLAGWWGQGRFYAGGQVVAASKDVARARLMTADGMELEDDTDCGVVLFLTDRPAHAPVTVDIYDREGQLLASHPAL